MDGWLDDRQLACSIFGIDDRSGVERMILDWIALQGLGNGTIKSIEISVRAAITVALTDKSPIFVKAWPGRLSPWRAKLPMKSDGSRTITWHGQERRRHLSAIGSSLPASDRGVAIGPDEVRIPSKRLSVPAGRGCRALLAQASLERV